MGSYFAIDALEPAMAKTRQFFSGKGYIRKWAKLTVLVIVFSLFAGGGANFNFSSFDDSNSMQARQFVDIVKGFFAWLAGIDFTTIVPAVAALFAFMLVLGFILSIIKYTAFFSILQGVTTNDVRILGHSRTFMGRSVSLSLFDVVLGLIQMPFGILLLAAAIGIMLIFMSGIPVFSELVDVVPFSSTIMNPVFIFVALIIGIPAILVFALIHYIKSQFGAYLMFTKNVQGALEAFKQGLKIVKKNKAQTLVLMLTQLVLGIILGIISFIIALIIAIPVVIIVVIGAIVLAAVGVSSPELLTPVIIVGALILIPVIVLGIYAVAFATTPITVFFFYYNLDVLARFLGAGSGNK